MDQECRAGLKVSRYFLLLGVAIHFLAVAQLCGFMLSHCEVMERVMFGHGTPYLYRTLFPGWRWILGVILFGLVVGAYAIQTNRELLFSFVCCAMFSAASYNLVYSYYQSVSFLDYEIDRYNQHQSEWTMSYAATQHGAPEGSSVVLSGYERPGLLPQMWKCFRRSHGLPEDAPPRKPFESPCERNTQPELKAGVQEKNSRSSVEDSAP